MCLFPVGRLVKPRAGRIYIARKAAEEENLVSPNANDVVRLLGLTKENQYEKAASFSNSMWQMPYEQQLRFKENRARAQMRRLSELIQRNFVLPIVDDETGLFRWLTMRSIVPSPKATGYRGKDGFLVNIGIDGNPATVGIPYGASRLLVSIPPSDSIVVAKPVHKIICNLFQTYLRNSASSTDLVAPNYFEPGGYKYLTVRSDRRGENIMVIAMFDERGYDTATKRMEEEQLRLADYFLGRTFAELDVPGGASSKISSLYFGVVNKVFARNHETRFDHLCGAYYIEEHVLGATFRISPASFFQINVDCAELLFRTVIDQCRLDKDKTVLLDVGCGAGVYSIVLSNHVRQAIGIDVNMHCIGDAEANAERNGVENTNFIRGRLETLPSEFFDQFTNTTNSNANLVAIVNPGRWGVMADTIVALRRLKSLSTLIYVSCYPYENAFGNFITLMKPPDGTYAGQPFRLTKVIPIDMFPHTPHYELILLFER